MIDKAAFEARVRAEAMREHPPLYQSVGNVMESITMDISPYERGVYIATRMEHEWPLVEALERTSSAIRDFLHSGMEYPETGQRHVPDPQAAADAQAQAESLLSPYTTKPIER